ncbi:hypothetical protein Sden_2165 [Shewanella denitrificans OS217]|uniref:Lipoprotein n=1 Tax=Shewanella denitrificans (strain OS217 / ATCC BAA-1090 / DSM 15013) TaxID=318161 RepID=Q12M79_SHEDO|nr:hypothetical protein Sden_2165 [Shewanella denitrificans OS217]
MNCIKCHVRILIIALLVIFICGCSNQPQYLDVNPLCEYSVVNDENKVILTVKAPTNGPWGIFHMLISEECRATGPILEFRGSGGGATLGTVSVSMGSFFSSIFEFFPAEPLMSKVIDNSEQMKDIVIKILSHCDDINHCAEFNAWHDARLAWLKHRNTIIPEYEGYNERHRIVKVRGLTCSQIEYDERRKRKIIEQQFHYSFRRWNSAPNNEYLSETVCPIFFDGEIATLSILINQAGITKDSNEVRERNIRRYKAIIQPSIDSIKFLGEVSQNKKH